MFILLDKKDLPYGFDYPKEFYKLVELNLVNLDVWYFMNFENAKLRLDGLKNRYPNRKLIPFARRDDCDDIACFEADKGEKVFIVHDFASDGWEQKAIFNNVWEWFKFAIDTMIEFEEIELG